MKLVKMRRIARGESGLTLIELMVAVAILGIIMVGIGSAFVQTLRVTTASNNHLQAINYTQNAGVWIVRDGQQAQTVTGDDPSTPGVAEVMSLVWDYSAYTLGSHTVHYALSGTDLTRSDNGGAPVVIARGIKSSGDFVLQGITEPSGAVYYKVTVISTVGGFQPRSASSAFYFKPRLS